MHLPMRLDPVLTALVAVVALLAAIVWAVPAAAKSLPELLADKPLATLATTKSPAAMELCLGLKVAEKTNPTVLRGDGETVVAGYIYAHALMAFRIQPRRVTAYGAGAWRDNAVDAVTTCSR